jgi:hypothetical protein
MAGEIEAGLSRHHDVEDQQVEAQPRELGARVGGRLRGGDAVTFGEQEAREQRADAAIIVDHQQMGSLVGERGGHEDMHALRSRERGCFLSCKLYGQTKFSQQPLMVVQKMHSVRKVTKELVTAAAVRSERN